MKLTKTFFAVMIAILLLGGTLAGYYTPPHILFWTGISISSAITGLGIILIVISWINTLKK